MRRRPRVRPGRGRVGAALGLAVVAVLGVGAGVRQLEREPALSAPDIGALPAASTLPTPATTAGPEPRARRLPTGPPAAGPLAAVPAGVPIQVSLPGVTGAVVPIGVRASGLLDLPDSPSTVGWWVGSGPAGSSRPTVLAGHVDSRSAGVGALAALRDVTAGSPIVLTDAFGERHPYRVEARRTYPKQALPRGVFTGAPLVLITCGGPFDAEAGSYRDNIVVYAVAN